MDELGGTGQAHVLEADKGVRMLPKEIPIRFTLRPMHLLLSPLGVLLVIGAYHLPWGADSAPAWVQAVGSVAAIAFAWLIPYLHEREKEERKRRAVLGNLGWVALRVRNKLSRMHTVIQHPADRLQDWQCDSDKASLKVHLDLLDNFPPDSLYGEDVVLLLNLREAAVYACELAESLYRWDLASNPLGFEEEDGRLTFHLRLAEFVIERARRA